MPENTGPGTNFSFSVALDLLKQGKQIRRAGWNGKGMFIYEMDGYPDGVLANEETKRKTGCDAVFVRPYIAMKDAQGFIVPGWLASQTDLLAEDWELVDK